MDFKLIQRALERLLAAAETWTQRLQEGPSSPSPLPRGALTTERLFRRP